MPIQSSVQTGESDEEEEWIFVAEYATNQSSPFAVGEIVDDIYMLTANIKHECPCFFVTEQGLVGKPQLFMHAVPCSMSVSC